MTTPRILSGTAALAVAAIVAAGCSSGGNTPSTPGPPPPASPSPTSPATTSKQVSPECASLVSDGQALVTVVTQFIGGQATGDQVRTAASDLSDSIDSAREAAGAQAGVQLDAAEAALQQLQTALTARPPDVASMRAAANAALTALRGAVTVCQSTTPG
ncbi:hypothetical protein [Amycolatopsis sp. GM8]|uniref:hypothetical protein n=1 Tax=Amycolatopsis sp. GM8 TaxID=2896530 RepID=UPI001F4073B7|nr:hypothetical protein [Amycolatopsis sp. GM8]